MRMRSVAIPVLVLGGIAAAGYAGCFLSSKSSTAGVDCGRFAGAALWAPPEQISAHVRESTEQEKYEHLICFTHVPMPGRLFIIPVVAEGGESTARWIQPRLDEAVDDFTITTLLFFYELMHAHGHYDVLADDSLMGSIDNAANRVKNRYRKKMAKASVDAIRNRKAPVFKQCCEGQLR